MRGVRDSTGPFNAVSKTHSISSGRLRFRRRPFPPALLRLRSASSSASRSGRTRSLFRPVSTPPDSFRLLAAFFRKAPAIMSRAFGWSIQAAVVWQYAPRPGAVPSKSADNCTTAAPPWPLSAAASPGRSKTTRSNTNRTSLSLVLLTRHTAQRRFVDCPVATIVQPQAPLYSRLLHSHKRLGRRAHHLGVAFGQTGLRDNFVNRHAC